MRRSSRFGIAPRRAAYLSPKASPPSDGGRSYSNPSCHTSMLKDHGCVDHHFGGSANTVMVGFPPLISGIAFLLMTPPSPEMTATCCTLCAEYVMTPPCIESARLYRKSIFPDEASKASK